MTFVVNSTDPVIQNFDELGDNICKEPRKASCCGERKYELMNALAYEPFLTFDGNGRKIVLQTDDFSRIGEYKLTLIVKMEDYPTVKSVYRSFMIKITVC